MHLFEQLPYEGVPKNVGTGIRLTYSDAVCFVQHFISYLTIAEHMCREAWNFLLLQEKNHVKLVMIFLGLLPYISCARHTLPKG